MSERTAVAPVPSIAFWRAYWITLRPYLFFVSGVSGLVGLALVDGASAARVGCALVAFHLCYGLGQALTDTTQTDTDAIAAPYRPLVRGVISSRAVRAVSLAGLAGCAGVFLVLSPSTIPLSLAGIAGLATYTPLKRRWWGGPLWNAWIVALLPLMGALCAGVPPELLVGEPRAPLCAASVLFSYAVFVLLGYLKDVEADRAAGYDTLPVRFGRRVTVFASTPLGLLGLASSSLLVARGPAVNVASVSFVIGAALWLLAASVQVRAHLRCFFAASDDQAHRGVGDSVRSFVALHAAEAALLRPELAPWALLIVVGFELALGARPCREQI